MTDQQAPYWATEARLLRERLGASEDGLSSLEAERRLERDGPNAITESRTAAASQLLLRQVANPLVLILVFGAMVSMVLAQWIDALIILSIVAGSTLLGFLQEYRASTALARLRQRLALSIDARRDGRWTTVPVTTVVRGDLLRLSAGNLVPADGVVLEARDFLVTEAALTGESFPVEKTPGTVPAEAGLSTRTNSVFLGTSVRSGTATVLVAETGPRTVLGGLAGRLNATEEETEFARGLRQFGYMLSRVMLLVALFVLTVNVMLDRPPVDSLLFAVALAVGLSPELLPAIVSVTLSAGAHRLAEQGVLVRRLEAIENLGSMDILCTDKTGTLTKGDVELSAAVDVLGQPAQGVMRLAFINASLETGIQNPLDDAISASGRSAQIDISGVRKLDEIPYDFLRKRLTIVVAEESERGRLARLVTKGAVPNVIACCATAMRDGAEVPLDAGLGATIDAFCEARAREGYRVVAVATKTLAMKASFSRHDEQGLTLAGFLLFLDPIKEGITETIAVLRRIGVTVKIISGDNRHTAAHVGSAIGLDARKVLTGADLSQMKADALLHRAEETDIFAEVDPQQKEQIVRALQKRGHAVAYMGDGINDAPPLLAADVGISVDKAVDVARESADVVLLRPDLDVLSAGILDGRRTFENTLKYIKITVSANFGNMISMAVATLFLPFLPLAAKQILLNNFLSDFPSIAIATDEVDAVALERAQRWSISDVQSFMVVFGLISTVFDLLTFYLLHNVFRTGEALFQSSWFVVSLLTELIVVLILRTRLSAWSSRPSNVLLVSTVGVAALACALPYLGGLSRIFGLVPVPLGLMTTMLAVVAGYAVATELVKQGLRRRN